MSLRSSSRWLVSLLCYGGVCAAGGAAPALAMRVPGVPNVKLTAPAAWLTPRSGILLNYGQTLSIAGLVSHAPPQATVALERQTSTGWVVVVQAQPRHGAFSLVWTSPPSGPAVLRVALRAQGRDVAMSASHDALVGRASIHCAPAMTPPTVPPGDGWVTGGEYDAGGPAPGIYDCTDTSYTLAVTDQAGATVVSQFVPAGESYTLVLPAGTYHLAADGGFCRGDVTVTAGEQSQQDTVCAIP